MRFNVDMPNKTIMFYGSISLKELEEVKKFIGDDWEQWIISVEPRVIEVEKFVPQNPFPNNPQPPIFPLTPPFYPTINPEPYTNPSPFWMDRSFDSVHPVSYDLTKIRPLNYGTVNHDNFIFSDNNHSSVN